MQNGGITSTSVEVSPGSSEEVAGSSEDSSSGSSEDASGSEGLMKGLSSAEGSGFSEEVYVGA
ncbi:MAG: hypothetical protein KBS45_05315, partial [Clostridiales bacterium]|nr:hypothetical protein [Candidatus Coliplasma caballi]